MPPHAPPLRPPTTFILLFPFFFSITAFPPHSIRKLCSTSSLSSFKRAVFSLSSPYNNRSLHDSCSRTLNTHTLNQTQLYHYPIFQSDSIDAEMERFVLCVETTTHIEVSNSPLARPWKLFADCGWSDPSIRRALSFASRAHAACQPCTSILAGWYRMVWAGCSRQGLAWAGSSDSRPDALGSRHAETCRDSKGETRVGAEQLAAIASALLRTSRDSRPFSPRGENLKG